MCLFIFNVYNGLKKIPIEFSKDLKASHSASIKTPLPLSSTEKLNMKRKEVKWWSSIHSDDNMNEIFLSSHHLLSARMIHLLECAWKLFLRYHTTTTWTSAARSTLRKNGMKVDERIVDETGMRKVWMRWGWMFSLSCSFPLPICVCGAFFCPRFIASCS